MVRLWGHLPSLQSERRYPESMTHQAREVVLRLSEAERTGELAELCRRTGVDLLVLFGSSARGGSEPRDVDLAVRYVPETGSDVLGLLQELYQLTAYEDFDVLDLGRAAPLARDRALTGAKILYEARPGLFASQQIAALMERMDTDEMRRVELELLAR